MTTTYTPENTSPSDKPFLKWLTDHDLEPENVYRVAVSGRHLTAWRYCTAGGEKHIECKCPHYRGYVWKGDVCTMPIITRSIRRPVPMHTFIYARLVSAGVQPEDTAVITDDESQLFILPPNTEDGYGTLQ